MILTFTEFITSPIYESEDSSIISNWKDGGILLIKGVPQKDGLTRLYITRIKKISSDGIRGFKKANIYPNLNVITQFSNGSLKANKFFINNEIIKNSVGLTSLSIGLNAKSGKTPLWKDSVSELSYEKFLNSHKKEILRLNGIHIPLSGL